MYGFSQMLAWKRAPFLLFMFAAGQRLGRRGQRETWTPLSSDLRFAYNQIAFSFPNRFLGCARDYTLTGDELYANYTAGKHKVNATFARTAPSLNLEWSWDDVRSNPPIQDPTDWAVEEDVPIVGWRGGHVNQLLAYIVGAMLVDFLGLPYVIIRDASNLPADDINFTQQLCSINRSSALIDVEIVSSDLTLRSLEKRVGKLPTCLYDLGEIRAQVWGGVYAHYAKIPDDALAVYRGRTGGNYFDDVGIQCSTSEECWNLKEIDHGFPWYRELEAHTTFDRATLQNSHVGTSIKTMCELFGYMNPGWAEFYPEHGCTWVPPHCCPERGRNDATKRCLDNTNWNCSRIFHPRPGYLKGMLEAMINTYKLPYYVQYISHQEIGKLLKYYPQNNFLTFQSTPSPFATFKNMTTIYDLEASRIKRVQFPTDMMICDTKFFPARPDTPHHCDVPAIPVSKWVSQWFHDFYPAGNKMMQLFDMNVSLLQTILEMDAENPIIDTHELSYGWRQTHASGLCQWFIQNEDFLRDNFIGNCSRADQPVDPSTRKCLCHQGTMPENTKDAEPLCIPCPKDSFCPGRGTTPSSFKACGMPNSTTDAGRRRRVMGPAQVEDCGCMPGYGWPSDGPNSANANSAACVPCAAGLYKEEHRAAYCTTPCQGGSWSDQGSPSILNCTCPPGFFRKDTFPETECQDCEEIIGAKCMGGAGPPTAQAGHFAIIKYEENKTLPEFYKCWLDPEAGPCKDDNQCKEGQRGWMCSQCEEGWAKPNFGHNCGKCTQTRTGLVFVLMNLLLTIVAVYYATIMVENAVDHSIVGSVMLKIAFHHAFVTKLGIRMDFRYTFWAYGFSWCLHEIHESMSCIFAHWFTGEPFYVAFMLLFAIPLWVMISLFWCFIIYIVTTTTRHAYIDVCQHQANQAGEVIHVAKTMIELQIVDKDAGRMRMHNIENEIKTFIDDLVYKSRIMYIWRTILLDEDSNHDFFPHVKLFFKDSGTVLMIWCIWIHGLIGPKILTALWVWRPYREMNSQPSSAKFYAFGSTDPELETFTVKHTIIWSIMAAVFVYFFVFYPLYAFLQIYRHMLDNTLTKQKVCQKYGFLYHGLELTYPQVFYEAVNILIRFMVGMLAEGIIPNTHMTLVLYRILAVLQFVTHVSLLPYEKVGNSKLNFISGCSNLIFLMTSQVLLTSPDIYTNEDDSGDQHLIIIVSVVCWLFYFALIFLAFEEFAHAAYMAVENGLSPEDSSHWSGELFESVKHKDLKPKHFCVGHILMLLHMYHKRQRRRSLIFTVACRSSLGRMKKGMAILKRPHGDFDPLVEILSTSELVLSEPERADGSWGHSKSRIKEAINKVLLSCCGLGGQAEKQDLYLQRSSTKFPSQIFESQISPQADMGTQRTDLTDASSMVKTRTDYTESMGKTSTEYTESMANTRTAYSEYLRTGYVDYSNTVDYSRTGGSSIRQSWATLRAPTDMFPSEAAQSSNPNSADTTHRHSQKMRRIYNNSDRAALSRLLMDALNIMVTTHGLMTVPYCLLEYLFADCCFMLCQTRSEEMYKRQQVFEFIVHHPHGQEEGITEIFIANDSTPTLTTGKRSDRLKALRFAAHLFNRPTALDGHSVGAEAAAEVMLSSDKSQTMMGLIESGLTIQDLERYVTMLKCQDPIHTSVGVQGFAEQSAQVKKKVDKTVMPEKASQTTVEVDATVQTTSVSSVAVNADQVLLTKMKGDAMAAKKDHKGSNGFEEEVELLSQEQELWKTDCVLRGRIDAWVVDNSRLQATSSGLGLRKSPLLTDKDGLNCVPWGAVIEGDVIDEDWLEIQTKEGKARFLPRHVQGCMVIRPHFAKYAYDAMLEEAAVAEREAEVMAEETSKLLRGVSEVLVERHR